MRLPMQTEFRAIVQSEYGAPEKVLRIAKRQLNSEELGADDVLVKVIARPVHPGDIQIVSALPQGGPVEPIPEGTLRVKNRFARSWEDTSWKWLSTPSAEKRSTILRRFSMTAEPSSTSVHWVAT